MENYLRFNLKMSVAFVVIVFDDFSGRQLSGSMVTITVPGQEKVKPVVKKDGYYVMLKGEEEIQQIKVEAYGYNTELVEVNQAILTKLSPMVKVRLTPNRCYPVGAGVTCIEGLAEPESFVSAVIKKDSQQLRLLVDYKKNDKQITLFTTQNRDFEGKRFIACKGNDLDKGEIFVLHNKTDENEGCYQLDKGLGNDYIKIDTAIFPVYATKASSSGKYFLPINIQENSDAVICRMMAEGNEKVHQELELETGKNNIVNFEMISDTKKGRK